MHFNNFVRVPIFDSLLSYPIENHLYSSIEDNIYKIDSTLVKWVTNSLFQDEQIWSSVINIILSKPNY